MISIRRYLEGEASAPSPGVTERDGSRSPRRANGLSRLFRAALIAMGASSLDACPALGPGLSKSLEEIADAVDSDSSPEALERAETSVQEQLEGWGRSAARYYQQTAAEARDMLLVMARTAESVGERDQRCSVQLDIVTKKLKRIATLDDLSQIRASVEQSAVELKSSVERMTSEGRAMLETLHGKVADFQARLEEAEELASHDGLTRLRNRQFVESQMEEWITCSKSFCIALLDLNGFKAINDRYGHVAGDDILRQFAAELRSNCSPEHTVGRWGGDEFLVLLKCDRAQADVQMQRVEKWVFGQYTFDANGAPVKLHLDASIGLAVYTPPETLKQLLQRADAAMYRGKSAARLLAK